MFWFSAAVLGKYNAWNAMLSRLDCIFITFVWQPFALAVSKHCARWGCPLYDLISL